MKKTVALMLCLLLPSVQGFSAPAQSGVISNPTPNEIQKAPAEQELDVDRITETVGGVTAGAGAGLMTFAVAAELAGPVGWAAGLLFAGGLTIYLAYRHEQGHNDLRPPLIPAPQPQKVPPKLLPPEPQVVPRSDGRV